MQKTPRNVKPPKIVIPPAGGTFRVDAMSAANNTEKGNGKSEKRRDSSHITPMKVDTNVRQQLHHTRPVRLWISSCAGVSVSHHSYSTQQTESTEEETLHSIISDTENIQGSYSKHEFQAETKKLLDIVA
ncbi:heat shock 75 mitochondrial [Labeo rohita]|uniref:Heat shock 75 mitochondrial n=1 Tax=Labeo rohita TaxID=84645 RepID=A0A498MLS5_LABRO|nr:heat shock 75 mitochondrial [Labeo rohita]